MVAFPTYTHLTLEPTAATLYSDSYAQFTAYANYDDGHRQALPAFLVFFDTDNHGAATVNASGRVFGVAAGTATLTAHYINHPHTEPYTATAPLTVTSPPPPPPPPSARFSLAFGASTTEPYPAWTAVDTHPNLVTSYSIDRGRSYELDQTDAGRATVTITDPDGILDPTNPAGPHYGQIRPLLPAVLCRRNPVTGAWEERYRGFVDDYSYQLDRSQRVNRLTISLVDMFEIAASAEMHPGEFGADAGGQVYYAAQSPDQRIGTILTDLGIARRMFVTLTSTVELRSSTYSAGENPLSAVQEAADGEFPALANVFCDRHGRMCFLGRKARFDPAGTAAAADDSWDYHAWKAGDGVAVNASPADTAQVRALAFQRGLSKIINAATATEAGAPDEQIPARRVTDTASIGTYGLRSWSASNLPILQGDIDRAHPTSPATETRRFAQYYVANYAQPKDRINQITFRSLHPGDARAAANWDLLCRVDISDTIEVTVHTPGGGGFIAAGYFVEGVHEDVRPLAPGYDDVTLTLDLSPRAYYTVDPWATPLGAPDPTFPDTVDANPPRRSRHPRPTVHSRDHEHDGPDPIRLHYEKVGTGPGGGAVVAYSIAGELEIATGGLRYYALTGGTITLVYASVGSAPAGSGVTVRVNRNGSSIATVTIAAGANTAQTTLAAAYTAGDYFTVDVTAVGSSVPGSDLVVELQGA